MYPPRTENKPNKHAVFTNLNKFSIIIVGLLKWADSFCSFTYIDPFAIKPSLGKRPLAEHSAVKNNSVFIFKSRMASWRTPMAWRKMYFEIMVI